MGGRVAGALDPPYGSCQRAGQEADNGRKVRAGWSGGAPGVDTRRPLRLGTCGTRMRLRPVALLASLILFATGAPASVCASEGQRGVTAGESSSCPHPDEGVPCGPACNKMLQQKADELMGRKIGAMPIHAANTVGVAVSDKAEIMGMFP